MEASWHPTPTSSTVPPPALPPPAFPKVIPLELHRLRCPACLLLCRCTVLIERQVARFECVTCRVAYVIGLGADQLGELRRFPLEPEAGA